MKLALCMIALNEERYIADAIKSLKPVLDEIIVVDTGSTDRTKEIVKGLGAKVIDFKWCDDFSAARNIGLDAATSDWIIVIDGDERISPKDLPIIKKLIEDKEADAYILIQRNYGNELDTVDYTINDGAYEEAADYDGWYPSRLVRLFRNRKEYRFSYKVHELMEPSILKHHGKIIDSKIPIHHYGVSRGSDELLAKNKRYLDFALAHIKDIPDDSKPYAEAGRAYIKMGEFDKALDLLISAYKMFPSSNRIILGLTGLLIKMNRTDDAKKVLEQSLRFYPDSADILNNLGFAYFQLGNTEEGIKVLEKSLKVKEKNPGAYTNLGVIYIGKKDFEQAVRCFGEAAKLNPRNKKTHYNLGVALKQLGRHEDAIAEFEKILSLDKNHELAKEQIESIKKHK
ncbi:tetratricopeptide repeat protein [Candidatus Woesearchaeota archaeon]|nr:tetratricopeptide repeat protein [Candidatus Woesearchaeota archaeon]